jgi:long-subunit fatty acid transport protein
MPVRPCRTPTSSGGRDAEPVAGIIVCMFDLDFGALALRIHHALADSSTLARELVRVNRPSLSRSVTIGSTSVIRRQHKAGSQTQPPRTGTRRMTDFATNLGAGMHYRPNEWIRVGADYRTFVVHRDNATPRVNRFTAGLTPSVRHATMSVWRNPADAGSSLVSGPGVGGCVENGEPQLECRPSASASGSA